MKTKKRKNLAALAFLHPQVGHTLGARVAVHPVDHPLGVVTVALDTKVALAAVGEVSVLVGAKAGGVGALGHRGRVGDGQTDGRDLVIDDVQGLEASRGGGVFGGEADAGSDIAAADCELLVSL